MAQIIDTPQGKICYLHIPKCGGMWMRHFCKTNNLKYTLWASKEFDKTRVENELNKDGEHFHSAEVPPNIDKKNTFVVIRDPFMWYYSMYAFRRQTKWTWNSNRAFDEKTRGHKSPTFTDWIQNVKQAYPSGFLNKLYKSYMHNASYVFALENMYHKLTNLLKIDSPVFPKAINGERHPIQTSNKDHNFIKDYELEAYQLWDNVSRES